MADHGHGGGGHGGGGGGGGGFSLSLDFGGGISAPLKPLSWLVMIVAGVQLADIGWTAFLGQLKEPSWTWLAFPVLIIFALGMNFSWTAKVLQSCLCLALAVASGWAFWWRVMDAAGADIDWFDTSHGMGRLILGWVLCAPLFLVPLSLILGAVGMIWWIWQPASDHGHGHH